MHPRRLDHLHVWSSKTHSKGIGTVTHPLNTHPLNTHPNTSSHTLPKTLLMTCPIHPLNTPAQHTLSTHLTNPIYQHCQPTRSTQSIYQHTLFTNLQEDGCASACEGASVRSFFEWTKRTCGGRCHHLLLHRYVIVIAIVIVLYFSSFMFFLSCLKSCLNRTSTYPNLYLLTHPPSTPSYT